MKTVKSYNKNNGVTYVYEVLENKWDPVKKRPAVTRRMIGKIDPKTGEIVPTGKRGRPAKKQDTISDSKSQTTPKVPASKAAQISDPSSDYQALYLSAMEDIAAKDTKIWQLEFALGKLQDRVDSLEKLITSASNDLISLSSRLTGNQYDHSKHEAENCKQGSKDCQWY